MACNSRQLGPQLEGKLPHFEKSRRPFPARGSQALGSILGPARGIWPPGSVSFSHPSGSGRVGGIPGLRLGGGGVTEPTEPDLSRLKVLPWGSQSLPHATPILQPTAPRHQPSQVAALLTLLIFQGLSGSHLPAAGKQLQPSVCLLHLNTQRTNYKDTPKWWPGKDKNYL